MSFASHRVMIAAIALVVAIEPANSRQLRICADPNNLPFSNERLEGFENKIVALVASTLRADVEYTWWAQRRGFIRNTLNAKLCDLVPGTAAGLELLETTAPYYRSTYVFVTRPNLPPITSLDDPALRQVRVGVHLIGDDGFNVPPAHALARREIVANVKGYSIYGDYSAGNPPARLIEAVHNGEIDVAIAWGPLGGYFAGLQKPKLRVTRVTPATDGPLPMTFAIAMGLRRNDKELRHEIETALEQSRADIDRVLTEYRVPRAEALTPARAHP
jgi:mxaJ protein